MTTSKKKTRLTKLVKALKATPGPRYPNGTKQPEPDTGMELQFRVRVKTYGNIDKATADTAREVLRVLRVSLGPEVQLDVAMYSPELMSDEWTHLDINTKDRWT